MKRFIFLVSALILVGCEQPSDIDKCVVAQATQGCNSYFPDSVLEGKYSKKKLFELTGESEGQCIKRVIKTNGGDMRKECLKAQAGK